MNEFELAAFTSQPFMRVPMARIVLPPTANIYSHDNKHFTMLIAYYPTP